MIYKLSKYTYTKYMNVCYSIQHGLVKHNTIIIVDIADIVEIVYIARPLYLNPKHFFDRLASIVR